MSIHKTKIGTYRVRWREFGRLLSKTFTRKIDAEKFEAQVTLGKQNGYSHYQRTLDKRLTFSDFCEIWLRDCATIRKTESSLIRDRQIMRDYLFPKFGNYRLIEINKRDIVNLQSELTASGKLSKKSINNVFGLLKKILTDAVALEYLGLNPAVSVKPLKIEDQDFKFWTFEERDRFLSYAKAHNPKLYSIVCFAVHTGLRRGEVQALKRDCLDFQRKEIIVKRSFCDKTKQILEFTKGKKIRRVPMNDVVFQLLREKALTPPHSLVLPFNYHNIVEDKLKPICEKIGVTVISFHDLRHTFASHLAMAGVSVLKIKALLGHADIQTTLRYAHLSPGHLDGITDVLLKEKCSLKVPSKNLEIVSN